MRLTSSIFIACPFMLGGGLRPFSEASPQELVAPTKPALERRSRRASSSPPVAYSTGGFAWAQGCSCSKAAAARSTAASSNRRPTIWSHTGSLSPVTPHGTEAPGCPVMLNGKVKGIQSYGSRCLSSGMQNSHLEELKIPHPLPLRKD